MILASGALGAEAEEAGGPPSHPAARIAPLAFADIPLWAEDAHDEAFRAFLVTCPPAPALRAGASPPAGLAVICAEAAGLGPLDRQAARRFFEARFTPHRIAPLEGEGFLTGYFEPEFPASMVRTDEFPVALHGRPPDLVTLDAAARPEGLLAGLQAARRMPDGTLAPFPVRREIEEGGEAGAWPVIAWLRDPVDRFVMQVQGSARLRLADGSIRRVAYAGRNGHPYVSLGRLLSQREGIPPAEMTMDRLVARLKGDAAFARAFIWNNPSYVFFRAADELSPHEGPIGGAGRPLTPHRSVAADRGIWAYGLPLWLSGFVPGPERGVTRPLNRLTIIQDTGSAIVGPARFDLFHGAGDAAGFIAGLSRHPVSAIVLWPKASPP